MSKEGKEIEIEEDFIQSSGELLRQARLGKELSITEISRKTRISKSMVQYLENGEVEKLPGRTYEIGYIKLICQVTNTNPDPIVKKWIDEYYYNKSPDPYNFPEPSIASKRSIVANFGILFSVLIVLTYSGWYFYSVNLLEETNLNLKKDEVNIDLLSQYENNNQTNVQSNNLEETENQGDNLSKALGFNTQQNDLDNKEENFSKDTLNNSVKSFDNITKSLGSIKTTSITSEKETKIEGLEDNLTDTDLIQMPTSIVSNNGINDGSKIGLYNIENYDNFSFVGIEDSWLQIISTDGEMFYTGMVKKGHNLLVPNDDRLLITLGNAGAVGVEILNLGIKPIGQSGEIIQAVKLNYILDKISFVD